MARTTGTKRRNTDQSMDLGQVTDVFAAIEENVSSVVTGKVGVIRLALVALLAEGHILVEDVPGVGKTALARSIDCSVRRVQFTPDLLPSDVTGVTVYSPDTGQFEFRPGPVFANIVLGDEINRAGPKTQSAMLESMEERTVTIDGVTHELAVPFMVMATQNPIELEGTYPLPEAQRDRFMLRLAIGYPGAEAELAMLRVHGGDDPMTALDAVTDAATVAEMIAVVRGLHVADSVQQYIVSLCRSSREHPDLELGASPRASLAMLRAARALAALSGRAHVLPDDVKAMAPHLLPHRLILSPDALLAGRTADQVVGDLLADVPAPTR